MDDALAYFLDLRLQVRGRPDALAVVDRCLTLIVVRAARADAGEVSALEAEVEALRRELEARFGGARARSLH